MKQRLAPCNGTQQQWHHVHSPKVGRHPPTIAHYNGTQQWHHVHSPKVGRHPPTIAHYNGTQQWHHVHCTLQWHPGATSNPPKWFVALPPIESKNPYSYRYLGKKDISPSSKLTKSAKKSHFKYAIRIHELAQISCFVHSYWYQ